MSALLPDGEFTAFIARHRLAAKLAALHWQRVAVGMLGCGGALGYNLWRAKGDPLATGGVVALAVAAYLALALGIGFWRWRRLRAGLALAQGSAREQALAVADFVNARGALLLVLAAAGHALFLLGSFMHVRLGGGAAGLALLGFLAPTAVLLAHALAHIPDDRQLVGLHHGG